MMTTQDVLQRIFEGSNTNPEEIKKRYPYFKLIHLYNFLKDPQNQENRQLAGLHFTQHYWLRGLVEESVSQIEKRQEENLNQREEEIILPLNTVLDEVLYSPDVENLETTKPDTENNILAAVTTLAEQLHEVDNPLPPEEPVTVNTPVENAEEAAKQQELPGEATSFDAEENSNILKPSEELEEVLEVENRPASNDLKENLSASNHLQLHEVENPLPTEEPVSVNEPRKSLSDNASPHLQLPPKNDSPADTLLFEPLHTTDYFASQGIKITDEAISTDKMGKQLKSFTQWLKTMKKLPGLPEQNINKGQVDSQVADLAEISNREEEVVTESMAKAYLQQGKITKAREIYRKLSLIYPEKSAYFAALIEKS